MYSKILVAYERMEDARRALDKAATLATALHAELFVLGILAPSPRSVLNSHHPLPDDLVGSPAFNQLHEQSVAWASQQRVTPQVETQAGRAVPLIEHFAEEHGINLVVLGDVNHTGPWGQMLEGSAERVGMCTRCDVLLVR